MADINRIISLIDSYLEKNSLNRVEANEASIYLDKIGALSYSTKGQPLRKLLREGKIPNAEQPGGKGTSWFIRHSKDKGTAIKSNNLPKDSTNVIPKAIEYNGLTQGLPPIEDPESEILILGTLPGKVSLQTQQYYANENNHFWNILSMVFNNPRLDTYEDKLSFLNKHHIALWDVLSSANRDSSLDSDINNPIVNDLSGFIANHPKLRIICLNGRKAYSYLDSFIGLDKIPIGIRIICLPSTSSSNTHMTMSEKIKLWKSLSEKD